MVNVYIFFAVQRPLNTIIAYNSKRLLLPHYYYQAGVSSNTFFFYNFISPPLLFHTTLIQSALLFASFPCYHISPYYYDLVCLSTFRRLPQYFLIFLFPSQSILCYVIWSLTTQLIGLLLSIRITSFSPKCLSIKLFGLILYSSVWSFFFGLKTHQKNFFFRDISFLSS